MTGDANEVRDLMLSLNRGGSAATRVAVTAWLSNSPSGSLDEEASIDKVARNPDHYSIASDDQLLMTAQSGDQQAFVELCGRHSPMVKKRIFSIVRSHEDAEDALQDTLLRAYRHLGTFRRTCKFSTWLTSIGTNTALMILRKRKTRKEGHTDLLSDESGTARRMEHMDLSLDPEGLHARHQMILVVKREVDKLRPTLRSIIRQYYGAECSLEESAKALGISVTTAKSRLMRGRKTLRSYLRRRGVSDSRV
jgi:RNA polymerase sigma-70 factor (ECF subfamily)